MIADAAPAVTAALPNEAIFLAHLVCAGLVLLLAGRLGRTWLVALIVVCTILMNIAVNKTITLFGLEVTGGNVLFATVFLANDVLNEHFGKQAARQGVLIGFGAGLVVVVMMQFVLWYAPNAYDAAQEPMRFFFGVASFPRIVIASMVSYLLAQVLDIQVYQAIRRWSGGTRLLWLRSNASTWLAQAFDTVFFTTAGITALPALGLVEAPIRGWSMWWQAVVFAYVIKIGAAAFDTGFLYLTTWRPLIPPGSQHQAR